MELEQHHLDEHLALLRRQNELLAIIAEVNAQMIIRSPASQALALASGFATIAFRNFPGGAEKLWLVEKVFVYTSNNVSPYVGKLGVFVMDGMPTGSSADQPNTLTVAVDPLYQKDATNLAIAGGDEISPIYVKGGESLIFQWSGLVQNDRCVASWQAKLAWQGQG